MSRWEFMRQLEELLADISPNEREEALQYYNDYFNDAGRENEQEVIKALGCPAQVAEIVREGLDDGGNRGEFTENGFSARSASLKNEIIKKQVSGDFSQSQTDDPETKNSVPEQGAASQEGSSASQEPFGAENSGEGAGDYRQEEREYREAASNRQKKELPTWAIVLIVLGCIVCSPVILAAVLSVLGTLLGVLCAVLGIILGVGLAAAVLLVVAVALVTAGFGCMLAHPLTGIGLLGGGCICGALGILFLLCTVLLAGKGIPAVCRGIAYLYHRIFDRKKGVAA